ncbi:24821_t:CDS:2 [Cetraspora pellucida]|uniref:24821_t:CDS:1 n=1 Tax=Cetraspora pellucida TaxID=1433469 RepID=A0A9N9E034_9GLOM|nr:24821_t:CDS:2 [Cetraspora pellucida]
MAYSFNKLLTLTIILLIITTITTVAIIHPNEVANDLVDKRNLRKRAYSTLVTTHLITTQYIVLGVSDSCVAIYPTSAPGPATPPPVVLPTLPTIVIPKGTPQPIVQNSPTQVPAAPSPLIFKRQQNVETACFFYDYEYTTNAVVTTSSATSPSNTGTGSTTNVIPTDTSTVSSTSNPLYDKLTMLNFAIGLFGFIIHQII